MRRTEKHARGEKKMPANPDYALVPGATIAPEDSVMDAARLMSQLNVGALPVIDGLAVVGTVTDRDITLGAAARGRAPRSTAVAEVMHWYDEGDATDDAPLQTPSDPSDGRACRDSTRRTFGDQ
jgi:hypothetical protein